VIEIMKFKLLISLLFLYSGFAVAETISIVASRDATLIEHELGDLANGSGPALFAGRTGQKKNSIRRALVYFDLENALPHRARVKRVFLTMHLTPSNAAPAEITLYRVKNDWGEGASFSAGGGGAPAEVGDATWLHAFYTDQFWALEGGYFVDTPSATTLVNDTDFYTWQSSRRLVRDVRKWLRHPDRNHGWILLGDESASRTAKRFDSRESMVEEYRPVLTVEYRLPKRRKFKERLHKYFHHWQR
jgi:hypothetical protein